MAFSTSFAAKNTREMMLNSNSISDVKFILNDKNGAEKQISASKSVLSASSPVFRNMFFGALKMTGNVRITDVSAEGFLRARGEIHHRQHR